MLNLFKNSFRSLWKEKLITISLTFLMFITILLFTIFSSTSANLNNTYTNISKKHNLHDFTISENYVLSNPNYQLRNTNNYHPYIDENVTIEDFKFHTFAKTTETEPSEIYEAITTFGVLSVEETNAVEGGAIYVKEAPEKTYTNYLLYFPNISDTRDEMYQFLHSNFYEHDTFLSHIYSEEEKEISNIIFPVIKLINQEKNFDSMNSKDFNEYVQTNNLEINKKLSNASNTLINFVKKNFNPLQNFLNNQLSTEIEFRKFKSFNISNSSDNLNYKIIDSNPGDKIDSLCLINYNGKENGRTNFSSSSFAPLGYDGGEENIYQILKYNGNDEIKLLNKYRLLLSGQWSDSFVLTSEEKKACFNSKTSTELLNSLNDNSKTHLEYVKGNYDVFDKKYKYTIQSSTGLTPITCVIENWTSFFTVLNPQFLDSHNLSPISSNLVEINPTTLNNMTTSEILSHFQKIINEHQNNILKIDGGIPFIILGSGITPDFLYPSIGFESINPNFIKDAILFTNNVGYLRVYDSYPNPQEIYIVAKFLHSNNHNEILKKINEFGKRNMPLMQGNKIAFLADDTSNFLNSSSMRISFIPRLINNIDSLCFFLTITIILLTIIVVLVVISKFISANRQNLGILLANGISKKKIIFSLQPFAFFPSLIGCFLGYFIGLFLQKPTIGLLHNYWTIPTSVVSFSWITLCFSILIPFLIISLTTMIIGYFRLRTNTVTLMKSGSEYKVNLLAKVVKKPFSRFNIIFRFRTSLALSSMPKLIILTFLTSATISLFTFSINTFGKITNSVNTSLNSKQYSFAVDLYTPTNQGGQYTPVNADFWGDAGIIQTNEGKNYFPEVLFENSDGKKGDFFQIFSSYSSDVNISKEYSYKNSLKSFDISKLSNENKHHFNNIIPCISDNFGQRTDLQYLKNKTLEKTGTDFNIGALGISSNPWNIVTSLAPDNQINKMDSVASNLFNYAGYKAYPKMVTKVYGIKDKTLVESKINESSITTNLTSPYDIEENTWKNKFGNENKNFFLIPLYKYENEWRYGSVENNASNPANISPNILPINKITNFDASKIEDIKFVLWSSNCASVYVVPDFLLMLSLIHDDLKIGKVKEKIFNLENKDLIQKVDENNYNLQYCSIPLRENDETYTYILADGIDGEKVRLKNNTKIMGIKSNTKYIKLKDTNGNPLLHKLFVNIDPYKIYKDEAYIPVIINEFTSHKYGLIIGDKIRFDITNHADRLSKQIKNNSTIHEVIVEVVGISDGTIGEEIFMNQDIANYLLGLKSDFVKEIKKKDTSFKIQIPNQYYIDNKAYADSNDIGLVSQMFSTNDNGKCNTWGGSTDKNPSKTLWNFALLDEDLTSDGNSSLPSNMKSKQELENTQINVNPYGFNGVFTQDNDGSTIIANSISLYSPSGIFMANQFFDSEASRNVLKYGSNAMIAAQIAGFWNSDSSKSTPLGDKIYQEWKMWIDKETASRSKYFISNELLEELIFNLKKVFGESQFVNLVNFASDKNSSVLIYQSINSTINQIEIVILTIISLMTILIIFMITLMIIDDSKSINAIMNAIGYRDKRNLANVLSIYGPILFLSILISLPISTILNVAFSSFIFNNLNIFININFNWYSLFSSITGVCVIFAASGIAGYFNLKKNKIIDRIKQI